MTGFATLRGGDAARPREWQIRGVNGRGLDLRLRLPEGFEALEPELRRLAAARIRRGNVTITLRERAEGGSALPELDPLALERALEALAAVRRAAEAVGLDLADPSPAEVLQLRGVLDGARPAEAAAPEREAVLAEAADLLEAFDRVRAEEGAAIGRALADRIARIGELVAEARRVAAERAEESAAALRRALALVLDNAAGADPDRVAQELAMIAVRADVTEELDRLEAHVAAARELLAAGGPVGRRLDFLAQEFHREASTLCAKSGSVPLTRIGLELKTVIDQLREQAQNLE
ncbi:MAG: YicC family protein [Alphaproteobacteria bacterium]|nr:MAG: YicC family protein [Alphaproteobacteria bacterium]